jgi:hypothetical protein
MPACMGDEERETIDERRARCNGICDKLNDETGHDESVLFWVINQLNVICVRAFCLVFSLLECDTVLQVFQRVRNLVSSAGSTADLSFKNRVVVGSRPR